MSNLVYRGQSKFSSTVSEEFPYWIMSYGGNTVKHVVVVIHKAHDFALDHFKHLRARSTQYIAFRSSKLHVSGVWAEVMYQFGGLK